MSSPSSTPSPKKRRRVARQELKDNLAKLQAAVVDTKKAHHTYANSAPTLDDDEEPAPSSSFDFTSHATQLKAEIDSFMIGINPLVQTGQSTAGAAGTLRGEASGSVSKPPSKGEQQREKAIISETRADTLLRALDAEPITLQDMLKLATTKCGDIAATRFLALENSLRGVQNASEADWAEVLQPFGAAMPVQTRDILDAEERRSTEVIPTGEEAAEHFGSQLAAAHQMIDNMSTASSVSSWIQSVVVKLTNAFIAYRHHVMSTHDSGFSRRMALAVWAQTPEGNGKDVKDKEVLKTCRKSIRSTTDKVQKEMVARTRLLQLYARLGPIVFLDPTWEYKSFRNRDFAPTAQAEAIRLFEEIPITEASEHPLEQKILAAEWAVIYLVGTLYRGGADAFGPRLVRNYLVELRTCHTLFQ